MFKKTVLTAAFLLLALVSYGEGFSADDISAATGARLYWDSLTQKGMFRNDQASVVFRPDSPWVLINGNQVKVTGTVHYKDGELLFSKRAAQDIQKAFRSETVEEYDQKYKVSVILIDPGHGGQDPGATSIYTVDGLNVKLREKFINLDVALRLEKMLKEQYPDKTILLTRRNDRYLSLEDRVKVANQFELNPHEGMVFLSIHTNASMNRKGRGIETWYLPQDYRRDILSPDQGSENSEINQILNTLWEEEFTLESLFLAQSLQKEMVSASSGISPDRGIKEESWFVVTNKKMASALVELGFLTNAEDAELLRETAYLNTLTEGVFNGLVEFIAYFER